MTQQILQAVSEGDGSISSQRLVMVFVTVAATLVWVLSCVWPQQVQLITPPWEVVGLIVGSQGMKAWQRGRESS
jgi:hypothetical protein